MSLAPLVLLDTKIYLDSADLTGYSNKVMAGVTVADLDKTTFGSGGFKERVGGLFDLTASCEGFFAQGDLTKPDDLFWANLSNSKAALTFVPTGNAVGSLAYITRAMQTQYEPNGNVGELFAYSVDWSGNWPMARGKLLVPNTAAITTTGTSTPQQLGALSTAQRMYATLHIQAATGTSIAVTLQSAPTSGFSSPTTQATFNTATTIGGQTASVLGAVTDTWWRLAYTVVGSSSFTVASAAGIAAK